MHMCANVCMCARVGMSACACACVFLACACVLVCGGWSNTEEVEVIRCCCCSPNPALLSTYSLEDKKLKVPDECGEQSVRLNMGHVHLQDIELFLVASECSGNERWFAQLTTLRNLLSKTAFRALSLVSNKSEVDAQRF